MKHAIRECACYQCVKSREIISLIHYLRWELDKILPHPKDDSDSWDPLADWLIRRMVHDSETSRLVSALAEAKASGDILVVSMSTGGVA